MRIDKYLKLTRLIKRRSVAKEVIDDGVILLNGRVVKPSKEVKINDILQLTLGTHRIVIKVVALTPVVNKSNFSELYEVIEDCVIK